MKREGMASRSIKGQARRMGMVKRLVILGAVVGALALFPSAEATPITTGDHFTIIFTDTGPNLTVFFDSNPSAKMLVADPNVGNTATADIVLGSGSLASPGFFNIASLTAISGSVNLTSGLLTENLSAVSFDATTLDLKGGITG